MSDPLASFSLALAAGGGRVNEWDTRQLVAAGVTLLQRSAPLIRKLKGQRTAILLPASAQFVTALAASDGRGAVLVNPLASPSEIAWQLTDSCVGAVFTNAALAPRLPPDVPRVLLDDAPRRARVEVNGVGTDVDLGTHFGLSLEGDPDLAGRDEEAVIVYTSGMAGRPLGAILTHRNLLANARATVLALDDNANDHALAFLPMAHLFGLVVNVSAPLLVGARVTTMDRFHPVRALELLEQHGVTRFMGVPSMFASLLQRLEKRGQRLDAPALRFCMAGGAPVPVLLQNRWADVTGVELHQGYGLTEASPACLLGWATLPNRRGTLGQPVSNVDVEIHDPHTGAALGFESVGEICVRGSNVFRGYVSGGEAGLRIRDGWLHTGDLGVQHTDGSVTFRGLIKPMFTRNGFNIYPRELEHVIGEMPGIRAVRVRNIPEPTKENYIAVEVTGDVALDAVKRWCAERLSAYKQPSEIMFSDSFALIPD